MKKVALTGNIGCGKSYVAGQLKKIGLFVLDADIIAKQVREENIDKISDMFGMDASDTKKLSQLIFEEDAKRVELENFLYPLIIQRLKTYFEKYKEEKILVVEVPLLYEKQWELLFDEVWVVACEEELALKRLQQYRNIDKEEAKKRLKKQMPLEEKIKRADVIIYNNEKDEIENQIQMLLEKEGILC